MNAVTHTMPDFKTVLVVGSSTSLGAHDEEGLGWVARFSQLLSKNHKEPRYLVANAGVSGHTTRDGYMNLVNAVGLHEPSFVIVSLGTNDILVEEGVAPETTWLSRAGSINAFHNIIDYVNLMGLKLLIIGPQPVENDIVRFKAHSDRIKDHTGFRYENVLLKQLNDDIEMLCKDRDIPFLRIFEDWQSRSGIWTDGLHPNAKGHQLWAEQVYKKFVELYL